MSLCGKFEKQVLNKIIDLENDIYNDILQNCQNNILSRNAAQSFKKVANKSIQVALLKQYIKTYNDSSLQE